MRIRIHVVQFRSAALNGAPMEGVSKKCWPVQEMESTPSPKYSTIAPVPPFTVRIPATWRKEGRKEGRKSINQSTHRPFHQSIDSLAHLMLVLNFPITNVPTNKCRYQFVSEQNVHVTKCNRVTKFILIALLMPWRDSVNTFFLVVGTTRHPWKRQCEKLNFVRKTLERII